MLAAMAEGRSVIEGFAPGADCAATLACLQVLGVEIESTGINGSSFAVTILGQGPTRFRAPTGPLDARNSGTTMRLLAGILAAQPFRAALTGDRSLSRRPMRRVIEPLQQMGAHIESNNGRPPILIDGGPLQGIQFRPLVPSAQVKSAVLLAGLLATGQTAVAETTPTRNHTELALQAFGVEIGHDRERIFVQGGLRPRAVHLRVPGDVSSAAFWAVAAAGLRGSRIELVDVGLNPTRTAFLEILGKAGAKIEIETTDVIAGEPRGVARIEHCDLRELTIEPSAVPGLIDELPALAALATFGGAIEVRGAGELRLKESDRIAALVQGLRSLGADAAEQSDGFVIRSKGPIAGGIADAQGDHRLAMAFAIAALGARGPSVIQGAEAVEVSYPGFFEVLESVRS